MDLRRKFDRMQIGSKAHTVKSNQNEKTTGLGKKRTYRELERWGIENNFESKSVQNRKCSSHISDSHSSSGIDFDQ